MPSVYSPGTIVLTVSRDSHLDPRANTLGVVVKPHPSSGDTCGVDFMIGRRTGPDAGLCHDLEGTIPNGTGRWVSDTVVRKAVYTDFSSDLVFVGHEVGDIIRLASSVLGVPGGSLGVIVGQQGNDSFDVYFPNDAVSGHNCGGRLHTGSDRAFLLSSAHLRVISRNGQVFATQMIQLERARLEGLLPADINEPARFAGYEVGDRIVMRRGYEHVPAGSVGTVAVTVPTMNRVRVIFDPSFARGNTINNLLPQGSTRGYTVPCDRVRVTDRQGMRAAVDLIRSMFPRPEAVFNHIGHLGRGVRVKRNALPAPFNQTRVPSGTIGRYVTSAHELEDGESQSVRFNDGSYHLIDFAECNPRLEGLHAGRGSNVTLPEATGYLLHTQFLEVMVNGNWYPMAIVAASQNYLRTLNQAAQLEQAAETVPAGPMTIDTFVMSMGVVPRTSRNLSFNTPPRANNLGRRVLVMHVSSDTHGYGLREGFEGSIVSEGDNYYNVTFDDGVLRGGRNTISIMREHVRLLDMDSPTKELPPMKVGDRVIMERETKEGPPRDTEGVVLRVNDREVDVDFYPYRWRYGSDLGSGNARSCRRVPRFYVGVMAEPEAKALKAFYLIGIKGGKTFNIDDDPGYDDGKVAADAAKKLSEKLGHKVQARKNAPPDDKWREREAIRLSDGTYRPMPKAWSLEPIKDHFLHLAVKNPGMVSYTPNEEYGAQDRQVFTRPGSYVQKYYPSLDKNEVARFSAIAACDGQLEITTNSEEMVRIYRLGAEGKGPDSCMKYDFKGGHSGVNLPIHPIEVYGEGELALAYLRQGEDKIIARCLIWPEKKIFTRAYGDIAKIYAILEAEGYKRDNFFDAKIKRAIVKKGGNELYVVPYIDDCNSVQGNPKAVAVVDDGKNLIIKPADQGQSAGATTGFTTIDKMWRIHERGPLVPCDRCSATVSKDDLVSVIVDVEAGTSRMTRNNWCPRCVRNNSYQCVGYRERVSSSIPKVHSALHGGDYVSRPFLDSRGGYVCDLSSMAYYGSSANAMRIELEDGRVASHEYFRTHGFTCAGSGKKYGRSTREGVSQFAVYNSKMYHVDYVEKHPEVKNKTAGITATEKLEKKKSKKPTPYEVYGYGPGISTSPTFTSTAWDSMRVGDIAPARVVRFTDPLVGDEYPIPVQAPAPAPEPAPTPTPASRRRPAPGSIEELLAEVPVGGWFDEN